MLGKGISDPDGIEGTSGKMNGLGYLDVETVMQTEKVVCQTTAYANHLECETSGYEIHMGETTGSDTERPFLKNKNKSLGAMTPNLMIAGVYVHGMFADDHFRMKYLSQFRNGILKQTAFLEGVELALNTLANEMERHLNIDAILSIAGHE